MIRALLLAGMAWSDRNQGLMATCAGAVYLIASALEKALP